MQVAACGLSHLVGEFPNLCKLHHASIYLMLTSCFGTGRQQLWDAYMKNLSSGRVHIFTPRGEEATNQFTVQMLAATNVPDT
jgi:hypothetical protein